MKPVIDLNSEDDEQAPDIETMTTGTAADAQKHAAEENEQKAKPEQAAKPEDKSAPKKKN